MLFSYNNDNYIVQRWNSECVWEALTPKRHDIPRHPRIMLFKANHSGSLKTPKLTPKFRLVPP